MKFIACAYMRADKTWTATIWDAPDDRDIAKSWVPEMSKIMGLKSYSGWTPLAWLQMDGTGSRSWPEITLKVLNAGTTLPGFYEEHMQPLLKELGVQRVLPSLHARKKPVEVPPECSYVTFSADGKKKLTEARFDAAQAWAATMMAAKGQ